LVGFLQLEKGQLRAELVKPKLFGFLSANLYSFVAILFIDEKQQLYV